MGGQRTGNNANSLNCVQDHVRLHNNNAVEPESAAYNAIIMSSLNANQKEPPTQHEFPNKSASISSFDSRGGE